MAQDPRPPRPHPAYPCPRCGTLVPVGQRFCPSCAFPQPPRGAGCLLILLLLLALVIAGGLVAVQLAPPAPLSTPGPPVRGIPTRAVPPPSPTGALNRNPLVGNIDLLCVYEALLIRRNRSCHASSY